MLAGCYRKITARSGGPPRIVPDCAPGRAASWECLGLRCVPRGGASSTPSRRANVAGAVVELHTGGATTLFSLGFSRTADPARRCPKRAPGLQNTAYSRQTMSQITVAPRRRSIRRKNRHCSRCPEDLGVDDVAKKCEGRHKFFGFALELAA